MASYMDYAVENADQTGMLLGKAADAIMGVEDEEAAVNRIIKNADWSTPKGIEKLKSDVRGVSMDAYKELVTQLNATANAEASTQNTKLATESSIIGNKIKLNRGIYSREFERDATGSGMEFSIRQYLNDEGLEYGDNPPKTLAAASTLITKLRKKEGDKSTYITGIKNAVGTALENYVNMRAIQDSGLQGSEYSPSTTTPTANKFDTPKTTKSGVDNKFVEESEGFNKNDSPWDTWWNSKDKQQQLYQALQGVNVSMVNFGIEMFMDRETGDTENREDAIQKWMGGGQGDAYSYFLGRDPAELEAFVKSPIEYYRANIKTIEADATFTGKENTDLFANFDY